MDMTISPTALDQLKFLKCLKQIIIDDFYFALQQEEFTIFSPFIISKLHCFFKYHINILVYKVQSRAYSGPLLIL